MGYKLLFLRLIVICSTALTCKATTYLVGDNSGWEISTDFDTWPLDKRFKVGDVLVFQFSSSHSVNQVTKENYDACNTTNVLKSYSNGNTTVALSKPGDTYFVCGNRLHCLGGMKLRVNVEDDGSAKSPIGSPEAQPGSSLPRPSSKNDNPVALVPTSTGFLRAGKVSFLQPFLAVVVILLRML